MDTTHIFNLLLSGDTSNIELGKMLLEQFSSEYDFAMYILQRNKYTKRFPKSGQINVMHVKYPLLTMTTYQSYISQIGILKTTYIDGDNVVCTLDMYVESIGPDMNCLTYPIRQYTPTPKNQITKLTTSEYNIALDHIAKYIVNEYMKEIYSMDIIIH